LIPNHHHQQQQQQQQQQAAVPTASNPSPHANSPAGSIK
jgi:hypothetical protein